MQNDPGLLESSRLAKSLKNDSNVQAVGYTKGASVVELVIHIIKKTKIKYPENFEGFSVRVVVSGKFAPLGKL